PLALVTDERRLAELVPAQRWDERLRSEQSREQAVEDPAARGRLREAGRIPHGEHALGICLGEGPEREEPPRGRAWPGLEAFRHRGALEEAVEMALGITARHQADPKARPPVALH